MIRRLAFCAALLASGSAVAEPVACPDLAQAVQVGSCPTEAELKWGYTGYCSDNARMYDKDGDTCASFENYRQLKDTALWEAGEFQGYLSCALPAERLRASRPQSIAVAKAGALTRVVCRYDGDVTLVMRTRRACVQQGDSVECP